MRLAGWPEVRFYTEVELDAMAMEPAAGRPASVGGLAIKAY
jgi:hypothetical protein